MLGNKRTTKQFIKPPQIIYAESHFLIYNNSKKLIKTEGLECSSEYRPHWFSWIEHSRVRVYKNRKKILALFNYVESYWTSQLLGRITVYKKDNSSCYMYKIIIHSIKIIIMKDNACAMHVLLLDNTIGFIYTVPKI